MRKDPTEFRERFKRWKAGEKVYDGGKPIQYIYDKVDKSNTDFAKRLRDPNRKSIPDWQDPNYNATHKLSVGTDYNGNHYIYPEVQNVRGILKDYTNPKNQMHKFGDATGMISAEMRGDTIRINSIDDGIKFTQEYKSYYPGFDKGKSIKKLDNGTEDNPWLPKSYKTPQNSEPVSAKPTTTYIGDNNQPHQTDPVYQEPINPQTGRPYTVHELDKPLSGTDPLAAFIVENYVGGKVLSGIGHGLKYIYPKILNYVKNINLGSKSIPFAKDVDDKALRMIQENMFDDFTKFFPGTKHTRFSNNSETVGDLIKDNYYARRFGGKQKLVEELTPDQQFDLSKALSIFQDKPRRMSDSKGTRFIHMDDTGPQPVNLKGLVPKDATNSNSSWNNSIIGPPEIWWNVAEPYYSIQQYRSFMDVPRTYIATENGFLSNNVIPNGFNNVYTTQGVVPFEAIDYAIQPNIFGSFDKIKFRDKGKSIKSRKYGK